MFVSAVDGVFRGDWLVCIASQATGINTDIPKARRILFVLEPPEFVVPDAEFLNAFGHVVSPYRIPGCRTVQIPSVTSGLLWWYGIAMNGHAPTGPFMSLADIAQEPAIAKTRLISTISSSKSFLPGHRKRLEFVTLLKKILGDLIDVYGANTNPIADKRDALRPYQYHVAIENSVHPHYWTEKLADPILGRCVTFYYGAPSAAELFPGGAVIPIDIDQPYDAIETIVSTMRAGTVSLEAVELSRHRIVEFYNFPVFCDKLIEAIEAQQRATQEAATAPAPAYADLASAVD
jgi:hypothetical protein